MAACFYILASKRFFLVFAIAMGFGGWQYNLYAHKTGEVDRVGIEIHRAKFDIHDRSKKTIKHYVLWLQATRQ